MKFPKGLYLLVVFFSFSSYFGAVEAAQTTPFTHKDLFRQSENILSQNDYKKRCHQIDEFLVNNRYTIKCYKNYQHFNAYAADNHYRVGDTIRKGQVKIAGYNLWLAGSLRSAYKDWSLVARVINHWDVVGTTEILPAQGDDDVNNQNIVKFLNEGPNRLRDLQRRWQLGQGNSSELKKKIERLKEDLDEAPSLYRAPGYFRLLEELRELDPSWALILSPRADADSPRHIQEYVGFFYRASRVRPVVNEHCQEYKTWGDGTPYACFPNLRSAFMGRDTRPVFSRRPFLASFQSGKFDYSLLSNHVVFNSPDTRREMAEILKPAFGVEDYRQIGVGVNKQTFARFAETKIILELMNNLRKRYNEKDIIYVGDMNLEASNPFWDQLLSESFVGGKLLVTEPTTLTQSRFDSAGDRTGGKASNYDHFVLDPNVTKACTDTFKNVQANVFYYYQGFVTQYLKDHYFIRDFYKGNGTETDIPFRASKRGRYDYDMIPGGQKKMSQKLLGFKQLLLNLRTVNDGKIVWDDYRFDAKLEFFKERVFLNQLKDRYFYRVYIETLSDHFPIWMGCKTNQHDHD